MEILIKNQSYPMTCSQIADSIGVPVNNVRAMMCYYQKWGYGYFRRLKPLKGKSYRYKINRYGKHTYIQYLKRIKLGFDLNCSRRTLRKMKTFNGLHVVSLKNPADRIVTTEQMQPYIKLTKRGVEELGITEDFKMKIAGFRKI